MLNLSIPAKNSTTSSSFGFYFCRKDVWRHIKYFHFNYEFPLLHLSLEPRFYNLYNVMQFKLK